MIKKIFSIQNEGNYKVLNIFGLKIKHKSAILQANNQIKFLQKELDDRTQNFSFLIKELEKKQDQLIDFKKNVKAFHEAYFIKLFEDNFILKMDANKKKRLFIATGFISIVNIISILKKLDNENYQNFLIIHSADMDQSFIEYNKNLILDDLFIQIDFANVEYMDYIQREITLAFFDEIYTTIQPRFKLYDRHKNISLIEEGVSAYIHFSEVDYSNVKNIYLSEYCGLTYPDKKFLIHKIDKNDVKDVINKIIDKNNLDFTYLAKDNQILMLSQYIYCDILPDEQVVNFYKKHIDKLLSQGYNVLFKSHPRVNDTITNLLSSIYENNEQFNFFPVDIKYPVELIIQDLDLRSIVTSMSGGAINCSHLFGIPCFGVGANLIKNNHPFNNVRNYANIFINHVPHISELINNQTIDLKQTAKG